jgi:predicted nuclease with RNAse H fold
VRSLGIDVGLHHHDAVLLDGRAAPHAAVRFSEPSLLGDLVECWRPEVVAIDAPPSFAPSGGSRLAERELHRRGIRVFPCPSAERAEGNSFFDWMRTGFALFAVAAEAGFELSVDARAVRGSAVEVYPHGTAVALRGARPAAGVLRTSSRKRAWRAQVLTDTGLDVDAAWTVHQVDAALAALTGVRALEGAAIGVGRPDEGVIVVPVVSLLDSYLPEDVSIPR